MLLAAGYAPSYGERGLDSEDMVPVRNALDKILASHEPFPAVIVDRRWDLVAANRPALALLTEGVAAHLLEPPVNALRVSLHPEGLAPRIANSGRVRRPPARPFAPPSRRCPATPTWLRSATS